MRFIIYFRHKMNFDLTYIGNMGENITFGFVRCLFAFVILNKKDTFWPFANK